MEHQEILRMERVMKSYLVIVSLVLCIIYTACEKKQDQQVEELSDKSEAAALTATSDIPNISDDQLAEIYNLQERIKIDQKDIELRKSYCQKAYFPESNYIISMGVALLRNPKTGQAIPQTLAERVAMMDAARWVGYVETWIDQQYQPEFGQLNKQVNRPLQVLNRLTIGDSLFVFYATKTDKH
jgi:hypothetical protein